MVLRDMVLWWTWLLVGVDDPGGLLGLFQPKQFNVVVIFECINHVTALLTSLESEYRPQTAWELGPSVIPLKPKRNHYLLTLLILNVWSSATRALNSNGEKGQTEL